MRGAIVGFGNIAVHGHLPGWRERRDVEIVAVTDARAARRVEAEARLPRARWYDSAADLLDREPLDFVDICTPPSSHAALIQAALSRGLHVLCEKPLVCSGAELAEVTRAAAVSERVLHTVHNWHHAPIVGRAGQLVQAGAIGRVGQVVWHTLRTRPAAAGDEETGNWRVDPGIAGGGVLTDHGWHVFYVVARWIGTRPTAISARLETRRHTQWPVEDTATVRLAFPDATAEILLTWAADVRQNWAEITGTEGWIRLEDDTLVLGGSAREGRESRWPFPPGLSQGSHHPDWFGRVADEFLGAVNGSILPDVNLAEASLCVELETLARESSRRGAPALSLAARPAGIPVGATRSSS